MVATVLLGQDDGDGDAADDGEDHDDYDDKEDVSEIFAISGGQYSSAFFANIVLLSSIVYSFAIKNSILYSRGH